MKFSVIIPLYNKASYVAKAIGSVLAQTFTDYELVIMDDGSKDDSAAIASQTIEGHECCRLLSQENAGVAVARNNAVAVSQGDYLCFLDADDWWEPTFLEEMDKFIKGFSEAGIYGTNYTIVNETKRKTRVANVGVEEGFEKGYINYCQVYAKTLAMPLWTGAVCVPRKVFDEIQGFPKGIKLGEDFLLWIRIAFKYKVAFLNKPLSYYNQDVDVVNRGVGRLYKPEEHMLWNVGFLEEEEKTNPDYKQLIDNLRTYSLLPYYLSKEYHEAAKQELEKVDWKRQPEKVRKQYEKPLAFLRVEERMKRCGVGIKQKMFALLKN
jgi:glycosyltransferase involved in cell wall biosynthesis